jgi:hypothetical protein
VSKFSDDDAACVAIVVAVCLITAKNRRWIEEAKDANRKVS